MIPGLIWLFRRNKVFAFSSLAFYLSIFVASAMRRYPVGGGRTDAFSYPVTILLTILGIYWLTQKIKFGYAIRWSIAFLAMIMFFYHSGNRPKEYMFNESSKYVGYLNEHVQDTDALIIHPKANFAVGYYGKWDVALRPVSYWTTSYEVNLRRQNSLTLAAQVDGKWYRRNPEVFIQPIQDFLEEGYDRVYYISMHQIRNSELRSDRIIRDTIINEGYEVSVYQANGYDELIVYEKK
jgi:hypothetical protein